MESTWLKDNKDRYIGKRLYIIGCGPSIANTDLESIDGITFGVNGIFLKNGFTPDFYCTVSEDFWKFHKESIQNLDCIKFIPQDLRKYLPDDGNTVYINFLRHTTDDDVPKRFSYDASEFVDGGGTVIFVCYQIAYWLGFREIILLGVDHNWYEVSSVTDIEGNRYNSPDVHFHKDYIPDGGSMHVSIYQNEKAHSLANEAFIKHGGKILNATPNTMLDIIPKININTIYK